MALPLAALAASAAVGLAKSVAGKLAPPGQPDDRLSKAAREFETLYLEQMLDKMVTSGGTEGPLGENGTGGGIYRSMLVKEYAGALAKSGGIGLAPGIQAVLLRLQEGGHASRG